jgi:hypothetical protein
MGQLCHHPGQSEQGIKREEAVHAKLVLLKSGLTSDLLSGRVRVPESIVETTS